jgi:hypothetical protein
MNQDSIKLHHFINSEFSELIKKSTPISPLGISTISGVYDMILRANAAFHRESNAIQKSQMELLAKNAPLNIDSYIPTEIISNIHNSLKLYQHFRFSCNGRTCSVNMYYPINSSRNSSKLMTDCNVEKSKKVQSFFQNAIHKIYLWIYVSSFFARKSCSSNMTLHFYYTDLKKSLPRKKTVPIDTIHANTAFTTSCKKETEIHLFRKEEWFKVFIHETFHNLGFDFSDMNCDLVDAKLRVLFPHIQSKIETYNLYETYTEMWAETIHSLFLAFFLSKSKDVAIRKFCEMMKYDVVYSMFQCCKVLNHYNLSYSDLMKPSSSSVLYKELSPVFSYYVVRSILFFSWNEFISWCNKNNSNLFQFKKTQNIMSDFTRLISSLYKNPSFLEQMKVIESKSKDKHLDTFISNTLRMTVYQAEN